jgi:hypothetical protein
VQLAFSGKYNPADSLVRTTLVELNVCEIVLEALTKYGAEDDNVIIVASRLLILLLRDVYSYRRKLLGAKSVFDGIGSVLKAKHKDSCAAGILRKVLYALGAVGGRDF